MTLGSFDSDLSVAVIDGVSIDGVSIDGVRVEDSGKVFVRDGEEIQP